MTIILISWDDKYTIKNELERIIYSSEEKDINSIIFFSGLFIQVIGIYLEAVSDYQKLMMNLINVDEFDNLCLANFSCCSRRTNPYPLLQTFVRLS